tara:strand:- start:918 stop:1235 length:318 start_codon:yes stop_codon:yes gene_type:complete
MKIIILVTFFFFNFSISDAKSNWVGNWIALDEWQSEFSIKIKEDGSAESNYGDGDTGQWSVIDGNVEIRWESGKKDYIFRGVMGTQRLSKGINKTYTSGMRKLLD